MNAGDEPGRRAADAPDPDPWADLAARARPAYAAAPPPPPDLLVAVRAHTARGRAEDPLVAGVAELVPWAALAAVLVAALAGVAWGGDAAAWLDPSPLAFAGAVADAGGAP